MDFTRTETTIGFGSPSTTNEIAEAQNVHRRFKRRIHLGRTSQAGAYLQDVGDQIRKAATLR